MATEIREFHCTIPAGTPKTAPVSVDMSFPARIVTEIDINVPPGPAGQAGFGIGSAGTIVIPYGPQQWIVTDDEKIQWPLEDYVDSGSWTFFGYNTGKYDHTFYVRFLLQLLPAGQPVTTAVVGQVANLAAAPTTTTTTTPAVTAPAPVTTVTGAPTLPGATLPPPPVAVAVG